jgi:hypothetical protein
MTNFTESFLSVVVKSKATGWLTLILQVGGNVGFLATGILEAIFSREFSTIPAWCWVTN